jgi:hypothetical protein
MTGNSPTDRSKICTKRHILTDKKGIPLLSAVITSASKHDIKAVTKMLLIIRLLNELLNHPFQRKKQ